MWKYYSDYNYYDCFLGEHRLVIQPLSTWGTKYTVWLYLGKEQYTDFKIDIEADSIEDAKENAMKIVSLRAMHNMEFWKSLMENADKNIEWIK